MISNLKKQNIKFNLITEEEAKNYLKYNNDYFNICSYKNNFERYFINNQFVEKYIDLDFAYLKDLAIIDYRLRMLLFKMTINIEHYLKLKILNHIETYHKKDSYSIVNEYLDKDFHDKQQPGKLHNNLIRRFEKNKHDNLILKYNIKKNKPIINMPIWVFLENITFGEFINFYEFYLKKTKSLTTIIF